MKHKIITIMLLGVLAAAAPMSALAADAKVSADEIAFAADFSQIDEKAAGEEDNTLADGWKQSGPYWYFYEGGKPAVGWKLIDGKWYFFAANGRMLNSWLYQGGYNYYLGPVGDMAVGWKTAGTILTKTESCRLTGKRLTANGTTSIRAGKCGPDGSMTPAAPFI